MAEFPGRPRVTKGALVVFATRVPVPTQLILFPFNPDTMTRRFELGQAAAGRAPGGGTDNQTPATEPAHQLSLTLELDIADELEQPEQHPITIVSGLHPVVAALEQLLYPSVLMTALVRTLARTGSTVITPPSRPWVVFVWGPHRILPVKVNALSITEQQFDPRLNPIRARVELGMTALSADELKDAPGGLAELADVHAKAREVSAMVTTAGSLSQAAGLLPL